MCVSPLELRSGIPLACAGDGDANIRCSWKGVTPVMTRKASSIGLVVASAAVLSPRAAPAQRVSADIHVASWPVAGTIHIGDRPYGYDGRPRARYVVEERVYPRVIVVERRRGHFRDFKHWRRAKRIVVYYDGRDRYYDGYSPGYREITAYECDGRYYRFDDDYYRYDDGRYYGGGYYDRDRNYNRDRRYDRDRRGDRDRWDDRDDRRRRRDWDDDRRWERDHH